MSGRSRAGGERSAGEVAEELHIDPDNAYRLLRVPGSLELLEGRAA